MIRRVLVGSGARTAVAIGTAGSLLILLGASQGASPYTLKQPGAWFFGIPAQRPIPFPGPRPHGVLAFLGVLAVLGGMTLLALAWVWLVRARGQDGGLSWGQVALSAAAWTLPLLLVAPLFSRDAYTYAAQGQMMAEHLNPYRHGPVVLGDQNPFTRLTDPLWRGSVSPYGPLFLLLDEGTVVATGHSVLWTIELLRLFCLAGVWLAALGAASIARRLGKDPVLGVVLVALNPLLLLDLVAGAHDDALMLGLLVAGLALAVGGRPWLGVLCCALGAAFKAPALLGCAYIGWSCLAPARASLARRVAGAAMGSAIGAAVLGLFGLVSGLGVGWIKGLSNAGIVRLWLSPTTGIGMALGKLLQLSGVIHGRQPWLDTITVTRDLGAAVAGLVLVWLLRRAEGPGLVRATGLALLALALLGTALWPWYLTWGVAALAPVASPRERALLVTGSAAASYLGVPVGSVLVGMAEHASVGQLAGAAALAACLGLAVALLLRLVWRHTPPLAPGGLAGVAHRQVVHP
jgi:hypothetical protein